MIKPQTIQNFVETNFQKFSYSKRQQVTRLLFEISKREGVDFKNVVDESLESKMEFDQFKNYLMQRRFPNLNDQERKNYKLVELNIDEEVKIDLSQKPKLIPDNFVVEESVKDSLMVQRIIKNFPESKMEYIDLYKNFVGKNKFNVKDYNNRLKNVYIVRENYDFYKKCPCSTKSVSCGLHVVNLGSGCGFECSYCYLQDYINSPGIILPANIEDFFEQFKNYKQNIRICSGEITDSLIFDHITEYSKDVVNFFRNYPKSIFEFKTKSTNINHLLQVKGAENVVVGWSLNPQCVIDATEHHTASLEERLNAAQICMKHGYKIAFHFDPMIYFNGWEKEYKELVDQVFDRFDANCFDAFSIGTLRMTPKLKKIIESRFPENKILDEEFVCGHDGKYRYPFSLRTKMYSKMKQWIDSYKKNVYFYLCMEEKDACGTCEMAPIKQYVQNP